MVVTHVGKAREIKRLHRVFDCWERSIKEDSTPSQRDSIEFARLAAQRWTEASIQKRTASSVERMKLAIQDNNRQEIRMLAVAAAQFRKTKREVGICLLRRTWCNNIVLEFLAVHPALDEKENSPISGLGTGLLHHVCWVAHCLGANAIWGESTQNSQGFYDGLVDRPDGLQDLILILKPDYGRLKAAIERAWKKRRKQK